MGRHELDRRTIFGRLNRRFKKRFINIFEKVALHGHINCLKLAHEIGVGWDTGKAVMAAKSGNL